MNTQQLTSDIKLRFDHLNTKAQLKEKYQAKLLVAYQGGLWKATPELITFLHATDSDELIILDSYDNPIAITNRVEMFSKIKDTYYDVMERWYNELNELEKNR
jgi:hypothetical protein